MKGNRRGRSWPYIAGGIALVITGAVCVVMRSKPLLQSARVFCVVPQWTNQMLYPGVSHYFWQDDHNALIVPDDYRAGPAKLFRVSLDADGRASPPKQIPLSISIPAGCISVSPNGQYLAYVDQHTDKSWYLSVQKIDGSWSIQCPWVSESVNSGVASGPNDWLVWSPDSASICEFRARPVQCIRRFTIANKRIEEFPLSADLRSVDPDHVTILGFTGPNTLLIHISDHLAARRLLGNAQVMPNLKTPHLSLVEVTLAHPLKLMRARALSIPELGNGDYCLSPQGDRLFLAAIAIDAPSPMATTIHRFLPIVPDDGTVYERLWVTSLEGNDMKEIGSYSVPLPAQISSNTPGAYPWILDTKWTPDGKRIGFVYKDRLMTVPVD